MCPTLTVGSFFRHVVDTFLFNLIKTYRNPQNLIQNYKTDVQNLESTLKIQTLAALVFSTWIFSALCDYFNFFAFKGSHLQVSFDILQQTKVPKSPKGLPFYVFRHYETVQNSHFSFFFRKLKKSTFFCLQRVPFDILLFDILQQTGLSKSPKGPRFYRFKNFLSLRYSADFRRSRLVFSSKSVSLVSSSSSDC